MLVSGAALLFAALAFAAYELTAFRAAMIRNLSIEAQMVASSSASALLFNDPESAGKTLSALQAAPNILSGSIYLPGGRLFASYRCDGDIRALPSTRFSVDRAETYWFTPRELVLVRAVVFQGKRIGTVCLRSDLRELKFLLVRYAGTVVVVLCISLLVAFIFSSAFQRSIAKPIVELADIAKLISREKNYFLRAPSNQKHDELAAFVQAFNEMLSQIQKRDDALQAAQEHLKMSFISEREARLHAQRANSDLEQFAYSAYHELQEPLRMIGIYTQKLKKDYGGKLAPEADRYIGFAVQGAKRMAQLVADLVTYTKAARESNEPIPPLDAEVAVTSVLSRLQEAVKASGASITHERLPEVQMRRAHLEQIFHNLIANAITYRSEKPLEIKIRAHEGRLGWTFSVQDNGIGLDPSYGEQIFGIFRRLHGPDKYSGTGIGLALCRKLVHHYGGEIWVESELGRGAIFFFTAPGVERTVSR